MFLTIQEIKQLTGARQKHSCAAWLLDNHYLFEVGKDGWPVVLRAHVNARLGGVEFQNKNRPRIRIK